MQIFQQMNSEDTMKRYIDMLNYEWEDYEDFERKYGSDEHPECYAERTSIHFLYDGIGFILRKKLLDRDSTYKVCGLQSMWMWRNYEPIIFEQRARYSIPDMSADFEFLAKEMTKVREERGLSAGVPEKFAKYVKT